MGRYINWADVVHRYRESGKDTGSDEISSAHIYYAEQDVDGYLGSVFTAPFSSNNVTAKDLAIDFTYVRMSRRTKPKDAEAVFEALMKRIAQLKAGTMSMVTTSGDLLSPSMGALDSTTRLYDPTFTMTEPEIMHTDSSQLYTEEGTY